MCLRFLVCVTMLVLVVLLSVYLRDLCILIPNVCIAGTRVIASTKEESPTQKMLISHDQPAASMNNDWKVYTFHSMIMQSTANIFCGRQNVYISTEITETLRLNETSTRNWFHVGLSWLNTHRKHLLIGHWHYNTWLNYYTWCGFYFKNVLNW